MNFVVKKLNRIFSSGNEMVEVNDIPEDIEILGVSKSGTTYSIKEENKIATLYLTEIDGTIKYVQGKVRGTHYVWEYNSGNNGIHLEMLPVLNNIPKDTTIVKLAA